MSQAERDELQPEQTHSGFILRKEYLNDSLPETIRILTGMWRGKPLGTRPIRRTPDAD